MGNYKLSANKMSSTDQSFVSTDYWNKLSTNDKLSLLARSYYPSNYMSSNIPSVAYHSVIHMNEINKDEKSQLSDNVLFSSQFNG